jgi:hypothetical protein
MIIGRDLLQALGLDICFSDQTIRWEESRMPFRSLDQCKQRPRVHTSGHTLEEEIRNLRERGVLHETSPDRWQAAMFGVPIRDDRERTIYDTTGDVHKNAHPPRPTRTTMKVTSASSSQKQDSPWAPYMYTPTPMGLRTSPSSFMEAASRRPSSDDEGYSTYRVPSTLGVIERDGEPVTLIHPSPPERPPEELSTSASEMRAILETDVRLEHLHQRTRKQRPKKGTNPKWWKGTNPKW